MSTQETPAEPAKGQFVQFPGSPFELYQPYLPAGDQPDAIAKLVEGISAPPASPSN